MEKPCQLSAQLQFVSRCIVGCGQRNDAEIDDSISPWGD
jgi:hypothetical protein